MTKSKKSQRNPIDSTLKQKYSKWHFHKHIVGILYSQFPEIKAIFCCMPICSSTKKLHNNSPTDNFPAQINSIQSIQASKFRNKVEKKKGHTSLLMIKGCSCVVLQMMCDELEPPKCRKNKLCVCVVKIMVSGVLCQLQ